MRLTRENFRILSGGQTGVDRAALDAAIELGVPHGGWCPRDRRAEDGRVPSRYQLEETKGYGYTQRTLLNVQSTDATLILSWGSPSGGTGRTVSYAAQFQRSFRVTDLTSPKHQLEKEMIETVSWIQTFPLPAERETFLLNVAGPRASKDPGVYPAAKAWMDQLLERLGFYPIVMK